MKLIKFLALIIFVVLGASVLYHLSTDKKDVNTQNVAVVSTDTIDNTDITPMTLDLNAALKPRVLGDVNAPIKITEHSSFTCSHCGKFHKTTFDQFKADYIDTGRAYLVFSDFPLNAPALHASMIGRCLEEDQYFSYVDHLFKEQEKWAYDTNYTEFLKTTAAQHGLNENNFRSCLQNTELREGLLANMKAVQNQWDVTSTPSFVVNNKTVLSGAMTMEDFAAKIDAAAGVSPTTQTDTSMTTTKTITTTSPTSTSTSPAATPTDNTTAAPTAMDELKADMKTLGENVKDVGADIVEVTKPVANDIGEATVDAAKDIGDAVTPVVQKAGDAIGDAAVSAKEMAIDAKDAVVESVKDAADATNDANLTPMPVLEIAPLNDDAQPSE